MNTKWTLWIDKTCDLHWIYYYRDSIRTRLISHRFFCKSPFHVYRGCLSICKMTQLLLPLPHLPFHSFWVSRDCIWQGNNRSHDLYLNTFIRLGFVVPTNIYFLLGLLEHPIYRKRAKTVKRTLKWLRNVDSSVVKTLANSQWQIFGEYDNTIVFIEYRMALLTDWMWMEIICRSEESKHYYNVVVT